MGVLLNYHQNPSVRSYDFSHVKYCMSGAAPLSGGLMQQLHQVLPNASIGQGYGGLCSPFLFSYSFIVGLAYHRAYGDLHIHCDDAAHTKASNGG